MFDIDNDKVIIAYYRPNGEPIHYRFDFYGLQPASEARIVRCNEYQRQLEALKGQGCDVHVWDLFNWQRYQASFYGGKQRRNL